MKLPKATLFLQFAREQSRLCLNQVTNIQYGNTCSLSLLSPVLSLDCHFSFECPSSISNCIKSSSVEQSDSKSAYWFVFSYYYTEKTAYFPTLRCTYYETCHCPELISFMCSLDLRHIFKNVQIALVTKSIRVSPCFNIVSLKIVQYCTGFKINALVFYGSVR